MQQLKHTREGSGRDKISLKKTGGGRGRKIFLQRKLVLMNGILSASWLHCFIFDYNSENESLPRFHILCVSACVCTLKYSEEGNKGGKAVLHQHSPALSSCSFSFLYLSNLIFSSGGGSRIAQTPQNDKHCLFFFSDLAIGPDSSPRKVCSNCTRGAHLFCCCCRFIRCWRGVAAWYEHSHIVAIQQDLVQLSFSLAFCCNLVFSHILQYHVHKIIKPLHSYRCEENGGCVCGGGG